MSTRQKVLFCFLTLANSFFLFSQSVFSINLLANPGFEEPLLNWSASSGLEIGINVVPSSFNKRTGEKSCLIKHNKTGSYGAQQIIGEIIGAKKYLGKGYVFFNNENAKNGRIRIAWYSSEDGSGSQINTVDSNVAETPLPSWQLFDTGAIEAPVAAKSAEFRILLASYGDKEALVYFDDLSFEEVILPTSTPASISPTSTPMPTSAAASNDYENISISEYLPYPESGDEWVELYNGNNFEVNLNGWWIDDIANGGSSPKSISGVVSAHNYKQFFLSSAFLNNDGDDVRLLNGNQDEKDSTSFEISTKGKSWSRDSDGDWCQIDSTPNSANPDCPVVAPTAAPTPTATISLTPTPTKKITSTPTPKTTPPTATGGGEILGSEESSTAAFFPWEATAEAEPASQSGSSSPNRLLPVILMGAGFVLLFSAAFWLWYTQLRK